MKDQRISDLEQRLVETTMGTLAQVPFMHGELASQPTVEAGGSVHRPDVMIKVEIGATAYVLMIEVKSKGEPAMARTAAAQLLLHVRSIPRAVGLFAAPYISPQAAAICREAGIGYLDLAGNCYLSFGNVFIHVDGRPNSAPERRPLRSLYAPKAERVLRVLLQEPRRQWQVKPLAAAAGVSTGLVSKVKSLLQDREWTASSSDSGLHVTRPGALLDEWARVYADRRPQQHEFFCLRELPDVETAIADACRSAGLGYALTGLSAAARVAPFVRYQRADAYVSGPLAPIIEAVGLKSVPSGANVRIRTPYDEGVLYAAHDCGGIALVSALQNYLDLCAEGGRAKDGADFLRERIIEPAWGAPR